MKSVSFFIASRYLLKSRYEKSISTMAIIACMSIFIGTFSLALITAIMNGFEKTIHLKMQNIHPQATIYSSGPPINVRAVRTVLKKEFPEVAAMSPQSMGHVIIQTQEDDEDQSPIVALLKGVDPSREARVSALSNKMLEKRSMQEAIQKNHIALGKELARKLSVSVGDTIPLLYLEQLSESQKNVAIHKEHAVVGGLFDTGIDEFDSSLIVCSPDFFSDLFPEQGITQIGLSFHEKTDINKTVALLSQRLLLETYTWQELYPALVSALRLEKYTMFFILLLITMVAAMNIIALISMLITQKRADIAIMQAMGITPRTITFIFMIIGMSISGVATFFGVMSAWVASILLERYPFIQLPHVYYVSHLPAHMDWTIMLSVFIVVMVITFCATWFSAQRAQTITIAHVLRFEG